jgi:hypothetical protein
MLAVTYFPFMLFLSSFWSVKKKKKFLSPFFAFFVKKQTKDEEKL